MTALEIYELQIDKYGCKTKAYSTLNKEIKALLKVQFPDYEFPTELTKSQLRIRKKENVSPNRLKLKKQYERKVRKLTLSQNLETLLNFDKPKCQNKDQFQSKHHYVIDHKISILNGFKNNIPIEVIACIDNLRWISAYENSRKGSRNVIDIDNYYIAEKYLKQ